MINLDHVEATARAATQGKWYHVQPFMVVPEHRTIHGKIPAMRVDFVSTEPTPVHKRVIIPMPREECPSVSSENMAHIAAANPQTVLALVRIARAAVENERVRSTVVADRVRNAAEYLSAINAILLSRSDLVAAIADAGLLP